MARITIKVNQQLDKCGDEFLDERDFDMTIDIESGNEWVPCSFGDYGDCFIKKADMKILAVLLGC